MPAHSQVVIGTKHGDFFLIPSVLFSQGKLRTQTRHLQLDEVKFYARIFGSIPWQFITVNSCRELVLLLDLVFDI